MGIDDDMLTELVQKVDEMEQKLDILLATLFRMERRKNRE